MVRQPRIHFPGVFYHVIARGAIGVRRSSETIKETAEHFNRDPVVISKGIKGLEKKIRDDETISTAITVLHESLTKNRKKIFISLSLTPFIVLTRALLQDIPKIMGDVRAERALRICIDKIH